MKTCHGCGATKDASEFYSSEYIKDGMLSNCKTCVRAYVKAARVTKKHKDPLGVQICGLVASAKHRASELGLPFDIDEAFIRSILPTHCPVLNIPLTFDSIVKCPSSPSLDRFYPELGYTRVNTFVISYRANQLKGDGTLEEHKKILEWQIRTEAEVRKELNI